MAFTVKNWKNGTGNPGGDTPINEAAMEDQETRLSGYTDSRLTFVKGAVNHGGNASTARPTGYASIEWFGTVQPNNMIAGDTWWDTTP
jgi:hypothetical protein